VLRCIVSSRESFGHKPLYGKVHFAAR